MSRLKTYLLSDFWYYLGEIDRGIRTDERMLILSSRFHELEPECQEMIAEQAIKLANAPQSKISPLGALEVLYAIGHMLARRKEAV